jgi:hypothetical protein
VLRADGALLVTVVLEGRRQVPVRDRQASDEEEPVSEAVGQRRRVAVLGLVIGAGVVVLEDELALLEAVEVEGNPELRLGVHVRAQELKVGSPQRQIEQASAVGGAAARASVTAAPAAAARARRPRRNDASMNTLLLPVKSTRGAAPLGREPRNPSRSQESASGTGSGGASSEGARSGRGAAGRVPRSALARRSGRPA